MLKTFKVLGLVLFLFSQIFAQDTIWVKLNNSSPPYSDIGEKLGLNKQLLNKIISPTRHKLLIVESNYSEHFQLFGLSENQTRINSDFVFLEPIFKSRYVLLSNYNEAVENIDDISDKKIGLIKDSFANEKYSDKLLFYTRYNSGKMAVNALLNQKIKYLIVELSIAKYFLEYKELQAKIFVVNDNLLSTEIGVFVKKRETNLIAQLNSSILKFKQTKSYQKLYEEYYEFETNYLWVKILGIIFIVAILLSTIIYYFKKKNISTKISNYHSLVLKGLIIFRISPTYSQNDNDDGSNFKEEINKLQLKYNMLSFSFDYSGNSAKINVITKKKTYISDNLFLESFVDDLNIALQKLPKDKYIIDINISGEFSNLSQNHSFLIVNNGNVVGLNINKIDKTILPHF
jgi:hypothetical protein